MGRARNGDEVSEQAAEWIVRLDADDPAEREAARQGFAAWKARDPRHAEAAEAMEALLARVRDLRDATPSGHRPARAALDSARRTRRWPRRAGPLLGLALALVLPLWLSLQSWAPSWPIADLQTARGEWDQRVLSDGSRLALGSATAANLDLDGSPRLVEVIAGEILVDVAADPTRPFEVRTRHGRVRALGTRFLVRAQREWTEVVMFESRVRVAGPAGDGEEAGGDAFALVDLDAGERLRLTDAGPGPVEPVDAAALEQAWSGRRLVVSDRPLSDVLDQLARYRPGWTRYDAAAVAGLRVTAVLPLDDPDRAMRLIAASFPGLRVRTLTPYLVLVGR
jgi:transmembrane sensor